MIDKLNPAVRGLSMCGVPMIPDRAEVRWYRHSDFEQIATAVGIAVKPIADLEAQFEAAALWFRPIDC